MTSDMSLSLSKSQSLQFHNEGITGDLQGPSGSRLSLVIIMSCVLTVYYVSGAGLSEWYIIISFNSHNESLTLLFYLIHKEGNCDTVSE